MLVQLIYKDVNCRRNSGHFQQIIVFEKFPLIRFREVKKRSRNNPE